MHLKSIGFLLFLHGGLAVVTMEEIYGMVGGDVELRCISPGKAHFNLSRTHVYWQTKSDPLESIKSYIPGENSSEYDSPKYKNRTSLTFEKMKRGDFSLHLSNITIKDEQVFACIVMENYVTLFECEVTLRVAANYSVPVVAQHTFNKEVTFTCTSHDGFPKPKVYWVNKTDNSLLNQTLQNDTFITNEKGLFSISSVLTIEWTPNINIECCIENVNLQQNLTVSKMTSFLTSAGGYTDHYKITTPSNLPEKYEGTSKTVIFVILGIVFLILLVVICRWLFKKNRRHGNYAGPQRNVQMAENNDYI